MVWTYPAMPLQRALKDWRQRMTGKTAHGEFMPTTRNQKRKGSLVMCPAKPAAPHV
jgi:hypothetical protein